MGLSLRNDIASIHDDPTEKQLLERNRPRTSSVTTQKSQGSVRKIFSLLAGRNVKNRSK